MTLDDAHADASTASSESPRYPKHKKSTFPKIFVPKSKTARTPSTYRNDYRSEIELTDEIQPVSLTEVAAQPPQDQESTLPPVIVRPEEPSVIDDPSTIAPESDFPPSYPGLSEMNFEGLEGATRGDKSLLDVPNLGTIINRQQLKERIPSNMFQALEREVGVHMQQTARGQASPYIRGLTGQQVMILVDGIRLNNATFRAGANQYFNTIDPGQVDRIEVLRGSQSVLYGSDAIGGAINIVTRGADPTRGDYWGNSFTETFNTADLGSYSRLNVEGWYGGSGIFTGGSYLNVHNLDRGGDLGRQPFTDYSQYAGDLKWNTLLGESDMLTFSLQHFEQQDLPRSDRFAPFVLGPPVGTPRPTFFDPQQRDLAYMRLQGVRDDSIFSSYMMTFHYARQKEGVREIRSSTRTDFGEFAVNTIGASLIATTDMDWLGKLTYGSDWSHDDVNANKYRYNPVTGVSTSDTPQFPDDSFYERVGAFLTWDLSLGERWEATSGVRYELIDVGGTPIVRVDPPGPPPAVNVPTHISPNYHDWVGNVGLTYKLTDDFRLFGSINEGFRAPNLDDLVATNTLVQQASQDIPSIDLGPEHSINYEMGLKLDGEDFRSQVAVFWTDLQDNIVRTPVAAGLFQRANRDSYLNGVEWHGEYLLTKHWSTYANFMYVHGINQEDSIPLSRIPPAQGILGLRWRACDGRKWFDVYSWLVRKQDRLNFQDLTDARIPVGGTPGYQTVNIRTGFNIDPRHRHQISLGLENIFDQAYRVHGSGVDGPGINGVLGYTYAR